MLRKKFAEKSLPRHSSGKMVYQLADLVIDNHCEFGDATLHIEGLETKTGPTSTIITCFIYEWIVSETINGRSRKILRTYSKRIL